MKRFRILSWGSGLKLLASASARDNRRLGGGNAGFFSGGARLLTASPQRCYLVKVLKSPGRNPMQRKASAVWRGGLKDGKGTVSTDSGVLKQTPYSFGTRFENQPGTN